MLSENKWGSRRSKLQFYTVLHLKNAKLSKTKIQNLTIFKCIEIYKLFLSFINFTRNSGGGIFFHTGLDQNIFGMFSPEWIFILLLGILSATTTRVSCEINKTEKKLINFYTFKYSQIMLKIKSFGSAVWPVRNYDHSVYIYTYIYIYMYI